MGNRQQTARDDDDVLGQRAALLAELELKLVKLETWLDLSVKILICT